MFFYYATYGFARACGGRIRRLGSDWLSVASRHLTGHTLLAPASVKEQGRAVRELILPNASPLS